MPQCDGMQLRNAAGQSPKKIMISGHVSEIALDKLQSLNAVFLEKPVFMKNLAGIIMAEEQRLNCN
jgi:hypothetical protein